MFIVRDFKHGGASDAPESVDEPVRVSPAHDEDIAEHFEENMFTRRSYLRALGHGDPILSSGPGLGPALVSRRQTHLVCHDTLRAVTRREIRRRSAWLFQETAADFILFEDVRIRDDEDDSRVRAQEFRYKANWRRDLSSGPPFMSSKQASALRRKQKKLNALFGASKPEFGFRRTRPGDLAAITDLNRIKIERDGGRYRMDVDKQTAMEILCADIGYTASLTFDGELLAGNIVCVAGRRSFFPLLGHDLAYEKYSPGSQVTSMALEELARMGCMEANFLWGDSRWKADFKAEREPLVTIVTRRSNRVLFTRDYCAAILPHAIAAAKASLKPHVKPIFDGLRATAPRRLSGKR